MDKGTTVPSTRVTVLPAHLPSPAHCPCPSASASSDESTFVLDKNPLRTPFPCVPVPLFPSLDISPVHYTGQRWGIRIPLRSTLDPSLSISRYLSVQCKIDAFGPLC